MQKERRIEYSITIITTITIFLHLLLFCTIFYFQLFASHSFGTKKCLKSGIRFYGSIVSAAAVAIGNDKYNFFFVNFISHRVNEGLFSLSLSLRQMIQMHIFLFRWHSICIKLS